MADLVTLTQHEYTTYKSGTVPGKQVTLYHLGKADEGGKTFVQARDIPTVRIPRAEFLRLIKPRQGPPMRKRGPVKQTRPACPCFTLTMEEYVALLPRYTRATMAHSNPREVVYVPIPEYARLLQRMAVYRPPVSLRGHASAEADDEWVPEFEDATEEAPWSPSVWEAARSAPAEQQEGAPLTNWCTTGGGGTGM